MEITGYGTIENITNDAEILITTRDFKTTGKITFYDGVLTWGEIETTDTEDETVSVVAPTSWVITTKNDENWYSYGGKMVNAPKISGTKMKPIKYIGTVPIAEDYNKTNNWANAITSDGSMFVWIPRFAYRISSGNHAVPTDSNSKSIGGTIEIAFINTNNEFLNLSDNSTLGGTDNVIITTDPTVTGAGTTHWLVHPAFTANATNGGGFGELTGIWFAKFETTNDGTEDTPVISVKPAKASYMDKTIGEFFSTAKSSTFGEKSAKVLNSHMAKNSEWGAVTYLAQSEFGTNGIKTQNNGFYYTGGINDASKESQIYTNNYKQSTTYNATGVYDMNGGTWEFVASYVNYANNSKLNSNTALTEDGNTGKDVSNAYKTVYSASGTSEYSSYELLNPSNTDKTTVKKGDAVYETSKSYSNYSGSWYGTYGYFPDTYDPFFIRGCYASNSFASIFVFSKTHQNSIFHCGFRIVLCM